MFSNEIQEKPPVPRRNRYGISTAVGEKQNSSVIQANNTETLVRLAKTTVGTFFVAPQGGNSLSTNRTEQRTMNYGTFSHGK